MHTSFLVLLLLVLRRPGRAQDIRADDSGDVLITINSTSFAPTVDISVRELYLNYSLTQASMSRMSEAFRALQLQGDALEARNSELESAIDVMSSIIDRQAQAISALTSSTATTPGPSSTPSPCLPSDCFEGDLEWNMSTSSSIHFVRGSLYAQSAVLVLEAPAVATIGASLVVQASPSIAAIRMDGLQLIGSTLVVFLNPSITTVSLALLTYIGRCQGASCNSVHIANNAMLTFITLPLLAVVEGPVTVCNNHPALAVPRNILGASNATTCFASSVDLGSPCAAYQPCSSFE